MAQSPKDIQLVNDRVRLKPSTKLYVSTLPCMCKHSSFLNGKLIFLDCPKEGLESIHQGRPATDEEADSQVKKGPSTHTFSQFTLLNSQPLSGTFFPLRPPCQTLSSPVEMKAQPN